tara:strand:- start:451 stop:987 length:537 start_codon:yes stop_codon:yes gene_type:complete
MSENDILEWSKNYSLNWSDFKAESNPAIFEDSHSAIKYGFTWIVNSDILNDEIIFSVNDIKVSVEFHPLLSWVRASESTAYLLIHERGHFDLAEMIRQDHDKIFKNKFYGKIFPTRGQNDAQRKQFAKEDSGRMISTEVDKLNFILLKKREEYDLETDFGKNIENQIKHTTTFEKLKY